MVLKVLTITMKNKQKSQFLNKDGIHDFKAQLLIFNDFEIQAVGFIDQQAKKI